MTSKRNHPVSKGVEQGEAKQYLAKTLFDTSHSGRKLPADSVVILQPATNLPDDSPIKWWAMPAPGHTWSDNLQRWADSVGVGLQADDVWIISDISTQGIALKAAKADDWNRASMYLDGFDLEAFFHAYQEAALWSSTDESTPEGGEPFDANYSTDDIAPAALADMLEDCTAFIADNLADLQQYAEHFKYCEDVTGYAMAGHDFWLTRNGHGAGYWDRGVGAVGEHLSEAAKVWGTSDLYVGDDGKIHVQ